MKIKPLIITCLLFLACIARSQSQFSDFQEIAGKYLYKADSSSVLADEALHGKRYLVILFSASYCGPCKEYVKELKEIYTKKRGGENWEVVFVSTDKSQENMFAYMRDLDMPWLAAEYDPTPNLPKIRERYTGSESGIPRFVVINAEGVIVLQNGTYGKTFAGYERQAAFQKLRALIGKTKGPIVAKKEAPIVEKKKKPVSDVPSDADEISNNSSLRTRIAHDCYMLQEGELVRVAADVFEDTRLFVVYYSHITCGSCVPVTSKLNAWLESGKTPAGVSFVLAYRAEADNSELARYLDKSEIRFPALDTKWIQNLRSGDHSRGVIHPFYADCDEGVPRFRFFLADGIELDPTLYGAPSKYGGEILDQFTDLLPKMLK